MIKIKRYVFNELEVNTLVLYDETRQCIIIDPGCRKEKEQQKLKQFIQDNSLKPVYIVNTHGHFDHIAGNAWAKFEFECPLLINKEDLSLLDQANQIAGIFGIAIEKSPLPDKFLEERELVCFGNSELTVLHVPGHSPGSICLYSAHDGLLICGDVLFNGSIGRTDLMEGGFNLLITGIHEKLMVLPRETIVWPGHGINTTIGAEYDTNPFLK
jgi:hydroxyacylglutathione hydrolase